jgi:transposase
LPARRARPGPSVVRPSQAHPELRNLTRYRKTQIEERTREAQRLDKILQDAGVKLSSVASDICGASGRAMLAALVGGTRDPAALAELAKGTLRWKIPALREALEGRFGHHHSLIVSSILAHLEFLEESIDRLSEEIGEAIAPFGLAVEMLRTIPGVDRRTAETLVAEMGIDMGRFGTSERLASWAGLCPGNNESAGKHYSGRTRKGSKWLRAALTQSAKAAARTKGSYFAAQYARLKGRRGHGRATVAVAHSILVVAFHILDRGVPYEELGADYFLRRHDAGRQATKLVRQLNTLGYRVTLDPLEAA